jgi:hypothetical protein
VNGEAGESVHVHVVEDINQERALVLILNQLNMVMSTCSIISNIDRDRRGCDRIM